jgi:hypothetical protein
MVVDAETLPIAEDGVEDGVVHIVVESRVDRAQLDAANKGRLQGGGRRLDKQHHTPVIGAFVSPP